MKHFLSWKTPGYAPELSKNVSVNNKNIQILTTEVYKILDGICTPIMKIFLSFREIKCNLRNFQDIEKNKNSSIWSPNSSLSHYLTMITCSLEYKVIILGPSDIKSSSNVNQLNSNNWYWKCIECICKLCKTYVQKMLPQNQSKPLTHWVYNEITRPFYKPMSISYQILFLRYLNLIPLPMMNVQNTLLYRMKKYTLIHTNILRPNLLYKNFIWNVLSIRFESGLLCRESGALPFHSFGVRCMKSLELSYQFTQLSNSK